MADSWRAKADPDSGMLVAGVLSGTSVDAIDVALVKVSGEAFSMSIDLVGSHEIEFPAGVRDELLAVSDATTETSRISQVHFLAGRLFGEAVLEACSRSGVPADALDLVGSHGQTIYHQGERELLCELPVSSTLQVGSPAMIARVLGCPVVSDFRAADIAAGGQGAPLVPYFDYVLLHHPTINRVALNIGGIANLSAIPAGRGPESVIAFDTGPGNMVVDQVVSFITNGKESFDRDGQLAAGGSPDEGLLADLLRHPYLERVPPKSTGRETFGTEFVRSLIERGLSPNAMVSTAAEFTARTVVSAIQRFVRSRMPVDEVVVAGGGWKNPSIMRSIRDGLPFADVKSIEHFGVGCDVKEAVAFAVLAYETYHGRPSSLPSATGADEPVVLGNITLPP